MENSGFLLYGYEKTDADGIKEHFDKIFHQKLTVLSASGCEKETVLKILQSGGADQFTGSDIKILILLGFDENKIQTVLKNFPKNQARPIFCCLTEHNIHWNLSKLIDHLQMEQKHWDNSKR